jgi:hypothetical protein
MKTKKPPKEKTTKKEKGIKRLPSGQKKKTMNEKNYGYEKEFLTIFDLALSWTQMENIRAKTSRKHEKVTTLVFWWF